MTLERGVHSRLTLAVLKLFILRIVNTWDSECLDARSLVTEWSAVMAEIPL